jgi:hypothetical protein
VPESARQPVRRRAKRMSNPQVRVRPLSLCSTEYAGSCSAIPMTRLMAFPDTPGDTDPADRLAYADLNGSWPRLRA